MPPISPDKLTAKGRATRDRIVVAAAELMSQHGVARTTIEDIRNAAAVSPSQMYHYFTDKNDLVSAVVDMTTDDVSAVQTLGLGRLESLQDLRRWRKIITDRMSELDRGGNCPIRSLTSQLSETDPLARARLEHAETLWEHMIRDGVAAIAARGELREGTDIDRLSLAMLAAIHGAILLSQVRDAVVPVEAVLDSMIEYLHCLGVS